MTRRRTRQMPGRTPALAFVAVAIALGGCRGDRSEKPPRQFFPDMDDQPRWDPQEGSGFYADGRVMRRPVSGTVPFGRSEVLTDEVWGQTFRTQRAGFLKESAAIFEGVDEETGEVLAAIPIPVSPELLDLGQKKFNIYCSVCHGFNAEGAGGPSEQFPEGFGGMVGRRWSAPVPSFHDPKYYPGGERGADGYLFTVSRLGVTGPDGKQRMPGYAHALSETDSWAIVAYIRALQQSRPLPTQPEAAP